MVFSDVHVQRMDIAACGKRACSLSTMANASLPAEAMLNVSAGDYPGVGWLINAAAAGVMTLMLWLLPAGGRAHGPR